MGCTKTIQTYIAIKNVKILLRYISKQVTFILNTAHFSVIFHIIKCFSFSKYQAIDILVNKRRQKGCQILWHMLIVVMILFTSSSFWEKLWCHLVWYFISNEKTLLSATFVSKYFSGAVVYGIRFCGWVSSRLETSSEDWPYSESAFTQRKLGRF